MECPISHVLNYRVWIKLIYDEMTLIYCVENKFNPTYEVQKIKNGVFKNAQFANPLPNKGYFSIRKINEIWVSNQILEILNFGLCQLLTLLLIWPQSINYKKWDYNHAWFLPRNFNFVSKIILLYYWETQFLNLLRLLSLRFCKIKRNCSYSMIVCLKD